MASAHQFGLCALLALLITCTKTQWLYEQESCTTPSGVAGHCITIDDCQPVLQLLDSAPRPLPADIVRQLQAYQCGFSGNRPLVCCPPTTPISSGTPPDVSNHRNLELLPISCGILDTGNKIINGEKAGLFEFPWMAQLAYRTAKGNVFRCGATILNDKYILTAAHCLTQLKDPLMGVRIGEHNFNTERDCEVNEEGAENCAPKYQDLQIEEVIAHANFNKTSLSNDIGLLRVSRMDLTRENVKAICLPLGETRKYDFTRHKNAVVTGWGNTEKGRPSPVLLKVRVPIVPNEECQQIYKAQANIRPEHLCAGGKTSTDSCSGDSGGPLQVVAPLHDDTRMVQQGIVSFGPRDCGKSGLPGVYTRVANYMDWILDNIKR